MDKFLVKLVVLGVSVFVSASSVMAGPSPARTLQSANDVLDDLVTIPLKGIPPALLENAQGVAIIPGVIKAGFVIGGRGGHGVVMVRDRNGAWCEPVFVNIGGGSFGLQAGIQSTDLVLVFKTRQSLNRILEGKGKLTLGADASVAAGPVGRQAEAATDAVLKAEIISYSRSRGLFAGVALDGAAIWYDANANVQFQRDTRPDAHQLAAWLQARIAHMSSPPLNSHPLPIITTPPPLVEPLVPAPEVLPPGQRFVPIRPEPKR